MKAIILNLIREDIKQTRFIQQLNNLGLSADDHLLNLSPIIFDLMQLDRSTPEKADAVQERYRELMEEFLQTDFNISHPTFDYFYNSMLTNI